MLQPSQAQLEQEAAQAKQARLDELIRAIQSNHPGLRSVQLRSSDDPHRETDVLLELPDNTVLTLGVAQHDGHAYLVIDELVI